MTTAPSLAAALLRNAGLCLTGLFIFMIAGCGIVQRSPESRYYVLALPAGTSAAPAAHDITGPNVGIGPVNLPGYLDRQQIFIREGNATDVNLSEYDRWGEPLSGGVIRILVEDMSARLAAIGGLAVPLRASTSLDWRISVDISRFDGAPGHDVLLDAAWSLTTAQGDSVREGHFVGTAPAGGNMDGLVRAHGALLSQLGDMLATAVTQAQQKTKANADKQTRAKK